MTDASNLPRLYVILDVESARRRDHSVLEVARGAFEGGARFFQCRFKELSDAENWRRVEGVAELLSNTEAIVTVNGRADMTVAAELSGVHLPSDGMPMPAVRRVLGGGLVGRSTHSLTEAKRAERAGADFATISPVFISDSKPGYGPPLEIDGLREVSDAVDMPLYALAGIEPSRVEPCLAAGARGVAVMSGICAAEDVEEATRAYVSHTAT